uniref:Retrotransposon gag domain-containing protein n=1 Tax=Romanomermis culicivorax TaxID=13658 RepID=A0A915JIX2_ROMCU
MPLQNQDPLGNIVQDALAIVLNQRLQNLEAQLNSKAALMESTVNEIRVNHLRGDMLSSKINDFPFFSGLPNENFTEWAKKLEKQMILKGIKNDDNELKRFLLEFHLRGGALTKFENILNSDHPPANYKQFKAALERAFSNQREALYHHQCLKDRKQKQTETVTAYSNELEKLGRLAYPTLDSNVRKTSLESIFFDRLREVVRKALKFKRFTNFEHLIGEAVFLEQEEG